MFIDWEKTRVRVQTAGLYQWRKGMRFEKTWHGVLPCQVLWLCINGKAIIQLHQGRTKIQKGTFFWLRPGWNYVCEQDPNDPIYHYAVYFDLLDQNGHNRQETKPLPPEMLTNVDIDFTKAIFQRLIGPVPHNHAQFSFHAPERIASITLFRGLLMELDAASSEETPHIWSDDSLPDSHLEISKIAAEISNSTADVPPIRELAKRCHMTPSCFCQAFLRLFNHTPQEYLIMWRIRHGKRLLIETDMTVKQIASYIGYNNPHFFSRQFKQQTNQTPLQYRNTNRGLLSVDV